MTTRQRTTTITRAVGGAGVLAILAAGCGGGSGGSSGDDFADQSAQEIMTASAEDMKALESVRVSGDIQTDGQEMSLDMQISAGGECEGTMSVMGGSAELKSTGDATWFRPDEAFWQATAGEQADQIMTIVGDTWVVMPPDQADLASLCDLDELLEEIDEEDSEAKKGETEEVDGQEAVVIESTTDEDDPVKAWVATEDEHYILQMEVSEGEEPGTISFSDFNEELDVQAPADDEVIDFEQMAG